ncbi:MAG: hypothetical protein E6J43_01805 [Chloroflexi bacterium]|nr:MAG: hypothetical protein E6J43_01805 [Chloroflexota bacterium]
MTRITALGVAVVALLLVGLGGRGIIHSPPSAEATQTTVTLFYGNQPDGSIGPIAGNGGADENLLSLSIPPFCAPPCYITSIVPDMVYWKDPNPAFTDGMIANYDGDNAQGIWLHHDAVADGCLQTVFLSGNERTVYQSPAGYGRLIGTPGSPDDPNNCNFQWFVGWHIHNSGNAAHKVRLKFTVTYQTGVTLNKLKGIGLNVATAVDAEYTIPINYSDTHTCPSNCPTGINTDHVVTAAEQGQVIAGGGHVHDYGIAVSAYNLTRGQWICTSAGGYGTGSRYLQTNPNPPDPGHPASANSQTLIPAYHQPSSPPPPGPADHIQNMSLCSVSPPGSILCTGDVIRVYASYNNQSGFPITDAMGILSLALPANPPDANTNGVWDGCETSTQDTDGDGYPDRVEGMVGTAANLRCGANAWPSDIDSNGFSDITDLTFLTGNFGSAIPPAPYRYNIGGNPPDAFIDITDVSRMTADFGHPCPP